MRLYTRLRAPPSTPPIRFALGPPSNLVYLNLPNNFLPRYAKSIPRTSFYCNGLRPFSHTYSATAVMDLAEEENTDKLRRNLEAVGLNADFCRPGQYDILYCPKVFADTKKANPGESVKLEKLSDELLAYFAERMISKETLERNNVMQVGDWNTIAFPYRLNGELVGCKYRKLEKRFWQEKDTEKVLYGLDDIADSDEIIIVEGEIDKLSVEEAGFFNCVSVPGGAPQTVSPKELPSPDKDTGFKYLWNCREYLDKASRIILAIDCDGPGDALAEELARRLGRESRVIFMAAKEFLLLKSSPAAHARVLSLHSCSQTRCFRSNSRKNLSFFANNSRPFTAIYQRAASGYGYTSCAAMPIPRPIPSVGVETLKYQPVDEGQLIVLRRKLREIGIDPEPCLPGQYHGLFCPSCKGGELEEKSLSLLIEPDGGAAVWTCFRAKCKWTGATRAYADVKSTYATMNANTRVKQPRIITEESLGLEPLSNDNVIAFTYRRNRELVSCKYRDMNKKFWQLVMQEANTEKIFYGLDDIKQASDVIIVEGEMDKLAMEEAGFRNCVSVPDGAPPKVSDKALPCQENDVKYLYLWNCKEYMEKASRIILATDNDAPGQALAEELARRLGRERCWRVTWPKKNDTERYKDANEVLMLMGPDALRDVIETAELYPIRGLFNFKDYNGEIDDYYHQSLGYELGVSTGWRALNDLYNVVPGELTIVTGVPNSGKSEWIDALLCNLNHSVGWKFALCSMENRVIYGEHIERMSVEELEQGKKCENDCLPNIEWVLDLARVAVIRHGINGLVIDPYNELDHQRSPNQITGEYMDIDMSSQNEKRRK
ncbi:nucleic acid binding protein [Striga asiatica]|uniref:Nucleic acid binding protein n=1 Tax=Striga asiatica TaxID=4170 RepID=A0A5A7NWH4_STRAF|nr:nucleic acid binding protein [Striga asiatica]